MDLSSEQGHGQVDGEVLQGGQVHLVLQGGAGAEEVQLKTEIMKPHVCRLYAEITTRCKVLAASMAYDWCQFTVQ